MSCRSSDWSVRANADPLKNSVILASFKPCSWSTVKPICSNRFAASLWKNTKNAASVWKTASLRDVSSINFIGSLRKPFLACLADMLNASVNSNPSLSPLILLHCLYITFRHSGSATARYGGQPGPSPKSGNGSASRGLIRFCPSCIHKRVCMEVRLPDRVFGG